MPFRLMSDSRSIKTINVLNKYCEVDVFYFDYEKSDIEYFNTNTYLHGVEQRDGYFPFFLRHSFFYHEFNYFAKEVLKADKRYDYIWAHDLPVLKPALILKNKLGAKVVYDCHEIYNETLNQFFPENARGIKKILFWLTLKFMSIMGSQAERKMAKKVDTCVTVGKLVKEYLEQKLKISNILVLYNCPYLQTSVEKVDFHALLNIPLDCKILLYQGVMNQGRGLKEMVYAQKHTRDNIRFILMGDGPMKGDLEALISELNLQHKIIFINRVNPSILLQYTRGADAGIVLQEVNKNLSKRLGIANKFFEYIHAGIPFIATDAPENRIVYEQFKVCKLVRPEHDVIEIANAINNLFDSELEEYKINALSAAKEYNWDKQEALIQSIIN